MLKKYSDAMKEDIGETTSSLENLITSMFMSPAKSVVLFVPFMVVHILG